MNMNPGFGSWLIGMSLGAGGGMLGMSSGMFIVLAATTFVAAPLYAVTGFGFAVLAAPLFLLFTDPAPAIQLVIIISTPATAEILPRGLRLRNGGDRDDPCPGLHDLEHPVQGLAPDQIKARVEILSEPGEIVACVVDHLISPERAHQGLSPLRSGRRHMGAQPFGDLDRERANAAGTARNEGLLPRLHAEFVSQRLERGQRRKGHARRFLEIHVGTQDEGTISR
jgi:hypothetical protein